MLAFKHRHCPLQPIVQPHLMMTLQTVPSGGSVIHCTYHLGTPPVCWTGCGAFSRAGQQTWPAWYPTRSRYCTRASCVGGIFSISLPFCVKRTSLARFTSSSELPQSYSTTTYQSKVDRASPRTAADGVSARVHSAGVTLLKPFHDIQAVRLPLPAKHDVV